MTYRILPNTRAGTNTEKSREARVFHTVFYQIHAPARTPKNPERRVYSIPYSTKYTRRHEHRKIQRGACIPYRILPNTRAGTNTEKSREARVFHTVFYQIHAPARTPKNPERRVYSGLSQSMSSGFVGFRTCSCVFNEGRSSVHSCHAHSTH